MRNQKIAMFLFAVVVGLILLTMAELNRGCCPKCGLELTLKNHERWHYVYECPYCGTWESKFPM